MLRKVLGVLLCALSFWLFALLLEVWVPDPLLRAVSDWMMFGMVIPATGFPLLYLTFYHWHRKPIGRALMTKAVGMLLLIDFSVFFALTNDQWGWAAEIQFIVFAVILLGLWYQFIVFLKIKRESDREKRALEEKEEYTARHSL